MKDKNPFEIFETIIKENERLWRKDIKDTKNPILKTFKQDYKDLAEIEIKLKWLQIKYGIGIKLTYPEEPKGRWYGKGIAEKLFKNQLIRYNNK